MSFLIAFSAGHSKHLNSHEFFSACPTFHRHLGNFYLWNLYKISIVFNLICDFPQVCVCMSSVTLKCDLTNTELVEILIRQIKESILPLYR